MPNALSSTVQSEIAHPESAQSGRGFFLQINGLVGMAIEYAAAALVVAEIAVLFAGVSCRYVLHPSAWRW
jgi:hypothetical protein